MARNRIIYQSQAVYAGPDKNADGTFVNSETPSQLKRIQSANYSFDIARQDVNQYGDLAAIDRVILESPTVSLDFSWYLCSFHNEDLLGFKVSAAGASLTSCLGDVLGGTADERNYYVRIVPNGTDASSYNAATDGSKVFGIGNGFMSSYSSEASVGGLPTCSLNVEALNLAILTGKEGLCPHVNASNGQANSVNTFSLPVATPGTGEGLVTALKPGDITLSLPDLMGPDQADAKVQSYNLSFDLAREPLSKLGSKFAFAREITFPVTVSLSVDLLVGDLKEGNLATLVSSDASIDSIAIKLNKSVNNVSNDHIAYVLKGAKLDGQSYSSSLGDNETATLNFSAQIGSTAQTNVGLFMSGVTL